MNSMCINLHFIRTEKYFIDCIFKIKKYNIFA
jgi:hypothetical protein